MLSAGLYLTHRCNLRCLYCSSPYRNTPELGTPEWRTVIDQLAVLGCRRVGILGGEPLLRPDLGEIIDLGVEAGLLEKSGAWIAHAGERLGNGREAARQYLLEHQDLLKDLRTKLLANAGIGVAPVAPAVVEPAAAPVRKAA